MNVPASSSVLAVSPVRARAVALLEVTKPRVLVLVLFTTLAGFYLGAGGQLDAGLMLRALLGTAWMAGGGAALNNWIERDRDARMLRTRGRPLPSGRLLPGEVLGFGLVLAAAGVAYLALAVNLRAGLVALVAVVSYVWMYTPLKPRTSLATVVGAVPGALPPVLGWVAARDALGPGAWALFAIVFLWQLPHFLAIAWMYREDYARGGYRMLPVVDPSGGSTVRQALAYAAALLPVSLLPAVLGLTRPVFAVVALVLGVALLACTTHFAVRLEDSTARRLFLASVLYLPLLWGALIVFIA